MTLPTAAELDTTLDNLYVDAINGSKLYQDPPADVTLRNGAAVPNLRKRLQAVTDAADQLGALDIAVTAAENAAALALAGSPYRLPTFAALSRLTYGAATGDQLSVVAGDAVDVPGAGVYHVAASGATDQHITTAGGVKLYVSTANAFVTPRMFAAAGDGITDDVVAIQSAWNFSGANSVPCHMEGLEYNASAELFYAAGMTVIGGGCVLYPTAWPATGGFLTNVVPSAADRIMGDIYMEDVTADGSKLPAPSAVQNTNLFDGAWGLYRSRFIRCKARFMRHGFGMGTGGAGFGVEQGAQDIVYEDCIAEDCYRAVRLAGFDTNLPAPNSEPKRVVGINFRNFTARRCWSALFAHTSGAPDAERSTVNLGTMSTVFDGVTVEDCGHAAWYDFDFVTYPTVPAQKSGVFTIAGYEGLIVSNVMVKLNSTYPASFTDWLGNAGYPANGTNYIGEGLSGDVGALVWGWGNEVLFENVLLDGDVDSILHVGRCNALGEVGASAPTTGTANEKCQGLQLRNVRQVAGAVVNVISGISGMNDSRTGIDLYGIKLFVEPTGGVSDANIGALTRVMIEVVTSSGRRTRGTAKAFYDGSYAVTQAADETFLGNVALGGGYSATGAKDGILHDTAAAIWRQSVDDATARYLMAFYNTNGNVGGVQTEASRTKFFTTISTWISAGPNSPEGVVTANVGSMWLRTDGGAGTTLYVKESGTGNTGWAAK